MTETQNIPRTIQNLITAATEIGGEVTETQPHRFEFALPCRMVGGSVELVVRATVGYYVRGDGKNVIGGTRQAREGIAYWAKQARR